ncbi:MAG: DNA-processing protein DprA [Nitrospira sp.]|nr:DNA-processing protein DprA [Nitrospira sp.]
MQSRHPTDQSLLAPWLRLRAIDGLGDATILSLLQIWATPEAVLKADFHELIERGCSRRLAAAITKGPSEKACRLVDRELSVLRQSMYTVHTILDASYPARLRMIPDPPPLLYVSGALLEADAFAVAVVGARRATAGGCLLTEELARDLAEAGVSVVSGLARGIDAAAHQGALSGGGRTIAVLGCGIDRTYPSEHARLRRQIEEQGAVVTEVPINTAPEPHNFPKRNRIISGLSLGVVVTEAALESGSLITARLACEQGREVFAVPGSVKSDTCRGTNALIKQGAALVECADDVVQALTPQLEEPMRRKVRRSRLDPTTPERLDEQERLVYEALSHEPRTVDEVAEIIHAPVSIVTATLLSLELNRQARQLGGQRFVRT